MSAFRLPLYTLAALTLALAVPASAGPIYKWVDAKGVTHYGEKAPDGAATSQVKVTDTTSSDAESEIERLNKKRAEQEESRKKATGDSSGTSAAEKARTSAACEQNRKNLENLRTGKPVRMAGDDGQARLLDEAAVAEQIRFAEEELRRCEQVQKLQESAGKAPPAPAR